MVVSFVRCTQIYNTKKIKLFNRTFEKNQMENIIKQKINTYICTRAFAATLWIIFQTISYKENNSNGLGTQRRCPGSQYRYPRWYVTIAILLYYTRWGYPCLAWVDQSAPAPPPSASPHLNLRGLVFNFKFKVSVALSFFLLRIFFSDEIFYRYRLIIFDETIFDLKTQSPLACAACR